MMKIIFFLIFIPLGANATGIPVVDTNQLVNEIRDSAYLLDAVNELVEEIGLAGEEVQYLIMLQKQLEGFATDLRTLQSFNEDVAELGEMRSLKGLILADKIRAFTNYLRKLKRVVATAASLRARPQAMLVTLQLLEQDRQRENERMESRMMAAAEIEKLNEDRNKIKREIARRQQLAHEKDLIFKNGNRSGLKSPMEITQRTKRNKSSRLL